MTAPDEFYGLHYAISNGENIYLVGDKSVNLVSGQTYYPILSVNSDFQTLELTSFESQENFNDPSKICSWYPYKEGFIIKECNGIGNRKVYWHSDNEPTQILSHAKTGDSQSLVFEYQGRFNSTLIKGIVSLSHLKKFSMSIAKITNRIHI